MSFTKLKEELMNTVTLNYFDATKKTVLTTDASESENRRNRPQTIDSIA